MRPENQRKGIYYEENDDKKDSITHNYYECVDSISGQRN